MIWTESPPKSTWERIQDILRTGDARSLQVFFRADDIAHVDEAFTRIMRLFLAHRIPLCLAVVPDWLDPDNWQAMEEFEPGNPLWCWHQHGRSHTNHELQGKKCEFGDSRSRQAIGKDLQEGRERLATIMGDLFYPVFTPPWNRCSQTTLELLREEGYAAVSRSQGAKPSAEGFLPDLAVNIDLHTRRENDFAKGWQNLQNEFEEAAASGRMGIMLHHQRMNEQAFVFLELLLGVLHRNASLSCCTFRELG